MKIFQWEMISEANEENILMVQAILSDNLISVPTDTVRALIGKPFSTKVESIVRKVKNRPLNKPFALLAADKNVIFEKFKLDSFEKKAVEILMPGSFTLVISNQTSFRIPNNNKLRALIGKMGGFVLGTSMNKSGSTYMPEKADEVPEDMRPYISIFVETTRDNSSNVASTVASVASGNVKIFRQGSVSETDIFSALNTN